MALQKITKTGKGVRRDGVERLEQRYPGFAEYEVRAAGIRTIPVLALRSA